MAKLWLNSIGGKLGERNLRTQTTLIFGPQELYKFFATPDVEVTSLLFVGDQALWISWQHSDERHAPTLKHANDVSQYTSRRTRGCISIIISIDYKKGLLLWHWLCRVCSAESRTRACREGGCLWAMTSKLKQGHHTCEFVGAGPNNYAYKTINTVTDEQKTVGKVRGKTPNYNFSRLVNFEKIRDVILNRDDKDTVTVRTEKKIKR